MIPRYIDDRLYRALSLNPVVYLNGPRQAGKSTVVRSLNPSLFSADYVTLDNPNQLAAATNSPHDFLTQRSQSLIIDEVQLAPELFRQLKIAVDELRFSQKKPIHGKYLLTGSANIMAFPELSQSLVGRMSVLTLYPLSSSEISEGKSDFINCLFNQEFIPTTSQTHFLEIMKKSTYPEIHDFDPQRRQDWFDSYITTLLQRDVHSLAQIEKLGTLPNLLRLLASRAGGLVNDAEIARDAGLNPMTCRNYKTLFKMLFITFEIAPWFRNIGKRLVKSPKGFFIDTMLLSHLLQYDINTLELNRPDIFGHVLENFVASELLKIISIKNPDVSLFHFRTSDNKEVDFILERTDNKIVGIEVKKSETVTPSDFKGLMVLQDLVQDDFVTGVVLYKGKDIIPFGKNLWAVPLSLLWQ